MTGPDATRRFATLGALFALLGVAFGAFGAHALEGRLSAADLATFEIAVRYQMYHALGLFGVAWATTRWRNAWVPRAGTLLTIGIVIFSGSLYLLVLTDTRWLGAVTPIGGVSMIVGWVVLIVGMRRE